MLLLEDLILNIAKKLLQRNPLLHDLFFVSLTRILGREDYSNYIKSPLLKAEAHIHLNPEVQVDVDNDVLEKALRFHPLGVLICISNRYEHINRRVLIKAAIFSYKRLEVLALAIGYTGSEELYRELFTSVAEEKSKHRDALSMATLLDFMTFRYCMDYVLPFTEDLIGRYAKNEQLPDILKKTLTSTLLASLALRKGIANSEAEHLLEDLRLRSDDLESLQVAPVLAKNIYFLGKRDVFKEILLRLNEIRRRIPFKRGMLDFITPPSPRTISNNICRSINIVNSTLSVLDLLSRSNKFRDEKFAIDYLRNLYEDLQSHIILGILTKIELRVNPHQCEDIIGGYLSKIERLLKEDPIAYNQLGQIFATKHATDEVKQSILEHLIENPSAIKHFVFGLYEETLKQYPLPF